MRLFLKKITDYFLLILGLWLLYAGLTLIAVRLFPNKRYVSHRSAPIIGKKKFILGNSHPECAINDSLLDNDYLNLSKSAEPLFYTCIKAQYLIDHCPTDTLIIEFENSSLDRIDFVLGERCYSNYKDYFWMMNRSQHWFLLTHNPIASLKVFASMNFLDYLNTCKIDGGYRYLVRDKIRHPDGRTEAFAKVDGDFDELTRSRNVTALSDLISNNPTKYFIITRMPVHKTYPLKNEPEYKEWVTLVARKSNCRYIDFNQYRDLPDSCFGDNEHLNFKGAKAFTPLFAKTIVSPQGFIRDTSAPPPGRSPR